MHELWVTHIRMIAARVVLVNGPGKLTMRSALGCFGGIQSPWLILRLLTAATNITLSTRASFCLHCLLASSFPLHLLSSKLLLQLTRTKSPACI